MEHEIIEFLLFYAIPRRNTNPIAHRLIDTFGNLRGVLQASEAELCKIDGISKQSALFLRLLLETYGHFCRQGCLSGKRTVFDGTVALLDYAHRHYIDRQTEAPWLLLFDKKGALSDAVCLDEGSFWNAKLSAAQALTHAIEHQAATAILFHKHPDGILNPSEADLYLTRHWVYLFQEICPIEEHYILTDTHAYGILQKEIFVLPPLEQTPDTAEKSQ